MAKLFKRGRIWYAWVPKPGGGVRPQTTLCTSTPAAEKVLARLEREAVDPAFAASNAATTQRVIDDYYLSRDSPEVLDQYQTAMDVDAVRVDDRAHYEAFVRWFNENVWGNEP